ncbi:Rho1 guanine nucleotide exchange factor 3 [Fusarium oxysporum f. sp. albedinis]|nr:Rho1 guanine nucleotide exchange factor 3 [Fusarium oxysporum f. sp. albedinis]
MLLDVWSRHYFPLYVNHCMALTIFLLRPSQVFVLNLYIYLVDSQVYLNKRGLCLDERLNTCPRNMVQSVSDEGQFLRRYLVVIVSLHLGMINVNEPLWAWPR